MKRNAFAKLMAAGVAGAFALGTALAGDSSPTTASPSRTGAGAATTSTTEAAGLIAAFSPDGNVMMVRPSSSAEPVRYYYFTPQTVVIDAKGAIVQSSALRPEMPVSVTYTKDGDRMVLTRVALAKPIAHYEKKETTTTTNTTP